MKTSWIAGLVLVAAAAAPAFAGGRMVCPTLPGTTIRDYTQPCYRAEPETPYWGFLGPWSPWRRRGDWTVYPTYPGTNIRDYSRPGLRFEKGELYPTVPGTNIRDYSQPGLIIQPKLICPTLPGTSIRDYSKACLKIE